ncbi:MAG: hypothetical protein IJV96_05070 [Clostridia bacterium]|nr:hypothetical protein [Clostridia bacterium]
MREYLSAVFGNRESRLALGKSIEEGRLSHAILIEGAEGSGKSTLAKELAMASLCEHRTDPSYPLPCRRCRACHLVEENLTPDVHVLSRGDKATIGVEAVREVRADAMLSATEFDQRFYIFQDAESMTVQAQNALLKVMEEPPTEIKILLLTTSADAMLTTVRSRARLVRMQRFSPGEIAAYLKEKAPALLNAAPASATDTETLLTAAQGSIGSALALLSPQSREAVAKKRAEVLSVIQALSTRTYTPILNAIGNLPTKRDELSDALLLLHTALRDLVLLKRTDDPPMTFFPSPDAVPSTMRDISLVALLAVVKATEEALEEIEKNANVTTVQALFGSRLREAQKVR